MFRNYLVAAVRHLANSRLHAFIAIGGLAVGLTAAIQIGLVIRSEMTHEHFVSDHERVYLVSTEVTLPGLATQYRTQTPVDLAARLTANFSEIELASRLAEDTASLRQEEVEAREPFYWADANVFDVLALPVLSGDLKNALERPSSIVIPHDIALKYFGYDDPVGETIELARQHPMTVTAVIADLPTNATELRSGIFASGRSSFSALTQFDNDPRNGPERFIIPVRTYVKVAPGTAMGTLLEAVRARVNTLLPRPAGMRAATLSMIRLNEVHLSPQLNPGISSRLAVIGVIGLLILFLACVNFVNLSTAQAGQRAKEVGIRKVAGADRGVLVFQFLGESLIYVLLALLLAAALTDLSLPHVNAFLNSGAVFEYWRDPALIGAIVLGALMIGVLAGFYPALVLSAFRPAAVLKGVLAGSANAGAARQILVTLQFAILIVLVIAAGVVYQQHIYATRDALRIDTDQMLVIRGGCHPAFVNGLRALPGVRGAACSSEGLLAATEFRPVNLPSGGSGNLWMVRVDFGAFETYGFVPIAGRFFSQSYGGDAEEARPEGSAPELIQRYVINESAARLLGFASPEAAIGQLIMLPQLFGAPPSRAEIIGVVADYSVRTVEKAINPAAYYAAPGDRANIINVKLTGRDIPETLAAMERLWDATGGTSPIDRFFLDDYIQGLYLTMIREAQAFAVFAGIAVLLACLGLFGLSVSAAERRTKEIGIRKAMGAKTSDIARLLLWQFAQPVLLANLIAWPVAYYVMNTWLNGFAYHVELDLRLFVGATMLALVIALLTVAAQSIRVARAKPVAALRYE